MKKLLFLSILLIINVNFAKAQSKLDTLPEVEGKISYQNIVDVTGKNKDFIYNAVHKWVFDTYTNPSAFSQDKDQGQILGKAYFSVAPIHGFLVTDNDYNYQYSLQIDCKDSKYRIQLYDMTRTDTTSTGADRVAQPLETFNNELRKTKNDPPHQIAFEIDAYLKWLISSLGDAINKAVKDDF